MYPLIASLQFANRVVVKRVPKMRRRTTLYISRILDWADTYFKRHGKWPNVQSGRIKEPLDGLGENWRTTVDASLRLGLRGLPGDYSLAQLLSDYRGVRNRAALPPLTIEQSCPGPTLTTLEPVAGHTANQVGFGEHAERRGSV